MSSAGQVMRRKMVGQSTLPGLNRSSALKLNLSLASAQGPNSASDQAGARACWSAISSCRVLRLSSIIRARINARPCAPDAAVE